jgi:hypothetical protein
MVRYRVHLAGTRYQSTKIEVEASSYDEAEKIALSNAGNVPWKSLDLEDIQIIYSEEINPVTEVAIVKEKGSAT